MHRDGDVERVVIERREILRDPSRTSTFVRPSARVRMFANAPIWAIGSLPITLRASFACSIAAAMLAGEAAIYVLGRAWLARFPLPGGLLQAGLVPFIAGDLYKLAVAVALLPPITRRASS